LELTSPVEQSTPAPVPEFELPPPASATPSSQTRDGASEAQRQGPSIDELAVEEPTSESIVEHLDQEDVVEGVPLDEEVTRWYQYPRRWMRGWDSHAELGLDGSTGNARTLALQTGLEMKRETERQILALDIDYRQASNRSVTTEDNGRLNLDYDRMLMDTPWSGFAKFGMEWDKFKAFDLRLNVNSGLGYHWIRRDDASLVTRFGAGASKEIGAPDDDWIPEAVFGAAAERQLTSRQKVKGKIDYFPAWEDFSNFRLVSDLAWEILLDGTDNLSLKLAATDRYDSTPQGAKENDLYYSLLLLYKF
jgi:putative salt-induced outer membrane protein YdiY